MTEAFSIEKNITKVDFQEDYAESTVNVEFDYKGVQGEFQIEAAGFAEDGEPFEYDVEIEEGYEDIIDFVGKCSNQEASATFKAYFENLYKEKFADERAESMDTPSHGSAKR